MTVIEEILATKSLHRGATLFAGANAQAAIAAEDTKHQIKSEIDPDLAPNEICYRVEQPEKKRWKDLLKSALNSVEKRVAPAKTAKHK